MPLSPSATGCSASASAGDDPYGSVAEPVTGPFAWKGYTWTPTMGGTAGVVPADPSNVVVDANGYLHLKITKTGNSWTVAEVFTTTTLGFGTYQWQIAGPVDRMDHNVVLGLYPYGPADGMGTDGTDEIDTEFSYWNDELTNVNADWGVYPPPPANAAMHWEDDFMFSLSGGTTATTRMVWTSKGVVGTLMSGIQPLGSNAGQLATISYMPSNPTASIPQQAMPLGMNLWCYKAAPANGQNVEVVIQDFQFIPEGQPIPDAGGPGTDDGSSGDSGAGSSSGSGSGSGTSSSSGSTSGSGSGSGTGSSTGSGSGSGTSSSSGSTSGGNVGGEAGGDSSSPGSGDGSANGFTNSGGSSGGCSCGTVDGRTDRWASLPLVSIFALALRRRRRS